MNQQQEDTTTFMAEKLKGKITVVTGAAGDLGSAICRKFASEGASVVLVDINKEGLNEVYESITKQYGDKHFQACGDVADSKFAQTFFAEIQEKYNGLVNVLLNCAGMVRTILLEDTTEDVFDEIIRVNLKSVFVMTKAFVDTLKTDDGMKSASIINFSSLSAKAGWKLCSAYSASTAGIIGLTKTIGIELGQYGIRCNAVFPGVIDSSMLHNSSLTKEHVQSVLIPNIPLRRLGQADEVANMCSFLASDESSYVSCACLEVTGGYLA